MKQKAQADEIEKLQLKNWKKMDRRISRVVLPKKSLIIAGARMVNAKIPQIL